MRVEYFKHNIEVDEIESVVNTLKTVFLTTGPRVKEFEERFSEYINSPFTVGVTSCTGAMHLALLRHGIQKGDEVITTPMTFAATATAILQVGAIPKFVDINKLSALLDPDSVSKRITKKTKAILVVHLYGRMADMAGFEDLARNNNLVLIEDAAHCIEGSRDGIKPGQKSHAACFSFYPTKSMTCGEGGALTCKTEDEANWYRSARHHGISKNAASRYTQKYVHWDLEFMGWKYNMDDIQAALLIPQIAKLDQYRQQRHRIEKQYREELAYIPGLEFIESPKENETSGHHLFTILVPSKFNRDQVLLNLQELGVGCAVNYRALHVLHFFKTTFGYQASDFPNAYEIGERTISLPLYPKLSSAEISYICDCLKRILVQ